MKSFSFLFKLLPIKQRKTPNILKIKTRRKAREINKNLDEIQNLAFVSQIEPKQIEETLEDENWLMAM